MIRKSLLRKDVDAILNELLDSFTHDFCGTILGEYPNSTHQQIGDHEGHDRDDDCMTASGGGGADCDRDENGDSMQIMSTRIKSSTDYSLSSLGCIMAILNKKEGRSERKRRLQMERQDSISKLEATGLGSFDSLNELSLDQLKDMQSLAQQHDAKYFEESPDDDESSFALGWIDHICVYA
jgi:hypothetical protein